MKLQIAQVSYLKPNYTTAKHIITLTVVQIAMLHEPTTRRLQAVRERIQYWIELL